MDKKKIIKENWGFKSILELADSLNINLKELLEIAFDLGLYRKNTPNIGRRWTEEEDKFLTEHSNRLSVRDASNLLYRSHYATYQRVRVLGLEEMINKK
ncbi:hypothetical protein [Neobacillus sp. SAB-20_R2A]|uniref:hypothetical protein n=1 Tax=Neobacillus sp. SAB-20_R2A TaxID=3120519 RepID=UPI003C6DE9F7